MRSGKVQLARAIKGKKARGTAIVPTQTLPGGQGTVAAFNPDGTVSVTYSGTDIPCFLMGTSTPLVGDSVIVLFFGSQNWCLDAPRFTESSTWMDVATQIGFDTNWDNLGDGLTPVAIRRVGDIVYFRGWALYSGGSIASLASSTVFLLPDGFIPSNSPEEGFAAVAPNNAGRIDVKQTGEVVFINNDSTGVTNPWVSLSGIFVAVT